MILNVWKYIFLWRSLPVQQILPAVLMCGTGVRSRRVKLLAATLSAGEGGSCFWSKEDWEQDTLTQEDVVGVTLETCWMETYLLGDLYLRLRILRMRENPLAECFHIKQQDKFNLNLKCPAVFAPHVLLCLYSGVCCIFLYVSVYEILNKCYYLEESVAWFFLKITGHISAGTF